MDQELASRSGDRDADLVREHEPTGALPMLLGDEHLDQIAQALLVLGVEQTVRGDVVLERRLPRLRERLLEQVTTTSIGQPVKHRRTVILKTRPRAGRTRARHAFDFA